MCDFTDYCVGLAILIAAVALLIIAFGAVGWIK